MVNKSNKVRRSKKNRKGQYLAEWRVLKSFGLAPVSKSKNATKIIKNIPLSTDILYINSVETSITPEDVSLPDELEEDNNEDLIDCDQYFTDLTVSNPNLHNISESSTATKPVFGRRVVDISYFIEQMKTISSHAPEFGCTISNMKLINEVGYGFRSGFVFQCDMCNVKKTVWSDRNKGETLNINTAAVAGTITSGGGYAVLSKIMGAMDIRCMSDTSFAKHHDVVSKGWEDAALEEMKLAADEEITLARGRGDVDSNNVPLLTVVADGSWSKRSYRTNYNAMSGVAAIVGYHTRKILYFGVKNKYCVTCVRTLNKGKETPSHICFKNWSGSSTSMEAAVIVEGFLRSEEMYGVKYVKVIADGDSSVYCKILENRPYDDVTVKKVECRNHLLRNFCQKLREISVTSLRDERPAFDRALHFKSRRVLGVRILRLRTAVRRAIAHRKTEEGSLTSKVQLLRRDLLNGPSHVFGEHLHCAELGYFCDGKTKEGELNHIPDMKKCGVYQQIMGAVDVLLDNSNHLIEDVDSNIVEHYNSTVAMFTGGKRVNYTQRNSYQARCAAAVVGYNTRRPFYKLYKKLTNASPGNFAKLSETRTKRKAEQELERRRQRPKVRRALLPAASYDKDYGPNAQKPDMDPEMYQKKAEEHMARLKKTQVEIEALEESTRGQSFSLEWLEERRIRLTASNFGLICNRKPQSFCTPVINKLLYSTLDTNSTKYGRKYESTAVKELEEALGIKVRRCGLFVDRDLPFLAASPDGLVEEDGIVEVKCPSSGSTMTPAQLIEQKKGVVGSFWERNKTISDQIKKKHPYYFQIQGQLHITGRRYCIFALWTPLGLKTHHIIKDDSFWEKEMVPKLEKFYYHCLLPELIDPRRRRNMSIREPQYIIDARIKRETTNTRKIE